MKPPLVDKSLAILLFDLLAQKVSLFYLHDSQNSIFGRVAYIHWSAGASSAMLLQLFFNLAEYVYGRLFTACEDHCKT